MGGGEQKRLFVSHGAEATDWANGLCSTLAAADSGLEITTAASIPAGDNIRSALQRAIQESNAVVLLIGAKPARYEHRQWTEVLHAYWGDQSKRLVPILLDRASPPPFIRGLSSYHADLDHKPDDAVVNWITSQLDEPSGTSAAERSDTASPQPMQPWVHWLDDDFDDRSQLLRRLDATIATLSEERPDEEELREHREALQRSCEERQKPKTLALAHLNIGLIDFELREHQAALQHLHRALQICETAALEGYPNRVSILIPLAETFAEMEKYADALDAMRQAAAIRTEEDGGESPGVVAIKRELGALLFRAGDYEEAADVLTHTLDVNRQQLGSNHPQVEANELWFSLAQEQIHSRDPSTPSGLLGVEPLTKVMRLLGLGYTMIEIDDLCGAQAALGRAVRVAEDTPQIPAPIRASCWFYNGVALCKSRQWSFAIEELQKAADSNKKEGIEAGWAASMFYLGTALRSNDETDKAVEVLSEVLSAADDIHGAHSIEVAENLYNLGLALRDRGDQEGAREHIDKATSIGSELVGNDDPRVIKYRRALARLDRIAA